MNPWSLDGRAALVTGAGRGIGRACAIELSRAGAAVALVARTERDLKAVAAEIVERGGDAAVVVADAATAAGVSEGVRVASALGDLRILVTAAGTNRPGPARDYPVEWWDELFDLNVRATFLACQAFGHDLLTRGVPGSIVTMSSQMGTVGYAGRSAYCATKHAVDGLTRALAVEWAREGIRVNAVAPTFVETPMTRPMLADPDFRREVLECRLPTGRLADVEDVAHAVRYLACDASNSVTGHVLRVDGGWTTW
jgi:NAD(P)-dependent dehydrogenase (short-subunit alcohol dehydrogenase family)